MEASEAQLYIGQMLQGQYEVVAHVNNGHFSGVFHGRDVSGGEVAIKILSMTSSGDASAVFEFGEEIRLLRTLGSCSNVVDIVADGQHTMQLQVVNPAGVPVLANLTFPYVVLERADANLTEILLDRHAVSWTDRLRLMRAVVKGVHQMHQRQIVHRDLKADNILLFPRGVIAKIADLGRSKNTKEPPNNPAHLYADTRGDRRFAPPELLWRQGTGDPVDALRADLYLLGSLFFELGTATGITSFALGDPLAIVAQAGSLDPHARRSEYTGRMEDMREQYELAYRTFTKELPPEIAHSAGELLRQLTNPDPARREPQRPFRGLPQRWDLQWLLVKIDILLKQLAVAEQQRTRRMTRLARKAVRKP